MKKRVLLVEDDAVSRELLFEWLAREGFEVQAVTSLDSARVALTQATPHAVLLDIGLGAQNGLELAAWIRRQAPLASVPVIAVTAHAMIADREFILQAGCNDYVPKPVNFDRLRESLQRWVHLMRPPPV